MIVMGDVVLVMTLLLKSSVNAAALAIIHKITSGDAARFFIVANGRRPASRELIRFFSVANETGARRA